MAPRVHVLGFRANNQERELIATLAQRHERTESDMMRLLVRREAERLGISIANEKAPAMSAGFRITGP